MTATAEGKMILWDVANKTELLQLITTQQGWTVIDNAGRFDSSEKGMLNVSWEAANKDIPLDSFSDKYYEPGLLATALENERYLNKKPTTIRKGITLPPQLNVVVTNINNQPNLAELTVEIYGQGGGIKDINLYHNGKVLPKKSFIVDDKAFNVDKKERRTLKVRITPTGGDNTIKVTALNKMDIQGQSKEISFNGAGQIKKPVLHVVTVAVDKYKDSRLNLDYSVSDASSISKDFNNRDISVFGSIKQQKLYNAAATKKAIMAELIKISNGAENDVLAVYAAGHGIAVDGEWYFLPHETTLEADLQYYTRVGISASEFSAVFIDSKIQHIILMIDACYSGATVDSFRRLQNAQRHFSRNMSKSIGITVIAATRKDQEAAELSELGHGLFTFVLSKGMNGDADSMPKNHKISAHELASFSIKTIPSFSTKFLGAAQEPTAFTMGKDFSLLRAN